MYELFDHTADLGLRVRAATLDELLADAARGLLAVLVANPEAVQLVEQRLFRLEPDEPPYLLFDWLNELLYAYDAEQLLLREFAVRVDEQGLQASGRGERVDRARHQLEHEVKAITYHGLMAQPVDDGWIAEVILDI